MATFKVFNPFDQSEIAELTENTAEEVELWLKEAKALSDKGPLSVSDRTAILKRTAALLSERKEVFALTIAKEGGKPLIDARVEVSRAIEGIEGAVAELHAMAGKEIPMRLNASSANRLAFTTHEPIGPVVAVSAFNHPLNLIVHQVIPAVAVGCPVIVKPANTTPLSCIHLVELLREAGLPEAWCRTALVGNEVAEKLVTDSRVAFFTFIGSSRIGWMLRSKLAPGTRCALEHGGAAPVIVEKDADLEVAIPKLVKGGYYHAGQVCVSVQRIFVHSDILESFKKAYVEAVKKLKVGDASDDHTEVGPLILPREVDRVAEWVEEAKKAGGEILTGGSKLSETTYEPTVVLDPPDNVRLSQAEVFGPVTVIFSFDDPDVALARANALDVEFQAAVMTQNIDRAMYYAHRINAAAVMINDHSAFRVDWMPFAGHQTSGHGIGGIPYTMEDMVKEKMIVVHSSGIPG
jgi:acyl-CoA reductase-like NAD-dependent aldehyde dehydrogenase